MRGHTGEERLHRFLLHVLPQASSGCAVWGSSPNYRTARLVTIHSALTAPPPEPESSLTAAESFDRYPCPTCGTERVRIIGHPAPHRRDGG